VEAYPELSATFIDQPRPEAARPGPLRARLPLVLLHGFSQTAKSWGPVVEALGDQFPLVLPDAPGHGASSELAADLWVTAELLAAKLGRKAFWAGYSMGGRTALHVALARPDVVQRLVLISSTAGIEDPAEREARRAADELLATRLERDGVAAFLRDWLAQPMFATLPRDNAGLPARLANTPAGLASSLRLAGSGTQEPLWDRLGELAGRSLPVLLVAGERDQKYLRLAERLAAAIGPSAVLLVVEGAGHACHLERPAEVAAAIAAFCAGPL
jgi:2-succinyl-6-hydroxy-2,4-cyclohexadiene-1-carboxylate synthase